MLRPNKSMRKGMTKSLLQSSQQRAVYSLRGMGLFPMPLKDFPQSEHFLMTSPPIFLVETDR